MLYSETKTCLSLLRKSRSKIEGSGCHGGSLEFAVPACAIKGVHMSGHKGSLRGGSYDRDPSICRVVFGLHGHLQHALAVRLRLCQQHEALLLVVRPLSVARVPSNMAFLSDLALGLCCGRGAHSLNVELLRLLISVSRVPFSSS